MPPGAASSRARTGRVLVVGSGVHETNRLLVREWRALGLDVVLLDPAGAVVEARPGDVALGRIDVLPTVDGVEPGLLALRRLEGRVARVLNPARALAAAHDKALTARLLARAGIPQPRTALVRPGGVLPPIEPPLVVKPRFGSWGVGVTRCDTADERDRALAALPREPWFARRGAIVQELVPPVGHDLRLLVADGRVVGATRRVPQEGEWRTNVALGAARVHVVPDTGACALAVAAARAIGADLIGVDLLPAPGGHVVVELNGAADFDEQLDIEGVSVFAAAAAALGLRGVGAAAAQLSSPAAVLP